MTARIGAAVESAPLLDGGRLFGSVDVEREFERGTRISVSGMPLASGASATRYLVGFGGALEWSGGRYAVSGKLDYAADGGGSRDYGCGVNLTVRFRAAGGARPPGSGGREGAVDIPPPGQGEGTVSGRPYRGRRDVPVGNAGEVPHSPGGSSRTGRFRIRLMFPSQVPDLRHSAAGGRQRADGIPVSASRNTSSGRVSLPATGSACACVSRSASHGGTGRATRMPAPDLGRGEHLRQYLGCAIGLMGSVARAVMQRGNILAPHLRNPKPSDHGTNEQPHKATVLRCSCCVPGLRWAGTHSSGNL